MIERAIGVLMVRYNISSDRAANLLVQWAQEAGCTVVATAHTLVLGVCGGDQLVGATRPKRPRGHAQRGEQATSRGGASLPSRSSSISATGRLGYVAGCTQHVTRLPDHDRVISPGQHAQNNAASNVGGASVRALDAREPASDVRAQEVRLLVRQCVARVIDTMPTGSFCTT